MRVEGKTEWVGMVSGNIDDWHTRNIVPRQSKALFLISHHALSRKKYKLHKIEFKELYHWRTGNGREYEIGKTRGKE